MKKGNLRLSTPGYVSVPVPVREGGEDEMGESFFSIFFSRVRKTGVHNSSAHTNGKKEKKSLATFTISQLYWKFWDARSDDDDSGTYILSLTRINNR